MSSFIPAGKTSSVRRGDSSLQIQTEYADRPSPRITTTVLHGGQVLHKFERKLQNEIESLQQQSQVEKTIKHQHAEVLSVIRTSSDTRPSGTESAREASAPTNPNMSQVKQSPEGTAPDPELSLQERFAQIPGFEHCFQMDNDGQFKSDAAAGQFRRRFKKVFKSRLELLEVFPVYESEPGRREVGVYEIERDRLFLVSTGDDCLIISVVPIDAVTNYERVIKETVLTHGN